MVILHSANEFRNSAHVTSGETPALYFAEIPEFIPVFIFRGQEAESTVNGIVYHGATTIFEFSFVNDISDGFPIAIPEDSMYNLERMKIYKDTFRYILLFPREKC